MVPLQQLAAAPIVSALPIKARKAEKITVVLAAQKGALALALRQKKRTARQGAAASYDSEGGKSNERESKGDK